MKAHGLRNSGIAISIAALACHAPTDPASNQTTQGGDLTHPAGTVVATTALGGQPYGLAINSSGDLLVAQVFADSVTRFSLPGTSPISATFFGLQGPVTDSGTSFIGT